MPQNSNTYVQLPDGRYLEIPAGREQEARAALTSMHGQSQGGGQPGQDSGLLSKLWDWASTGLVSPQALMNTFGKVGGYNDFTGSNMGEDIQKAKNAPPSKFESQHPIQSGIGRGVVGATGDAADVASNLTSPASLAGLATGGLASVPGMVGRIAAPVAAGVGGMYGMYGGNDVYQALKNADSAPRADNIQRALYGMSEITGGMAASKLARQAQLHNAPLTPEAAAHLDDLARADRVKNTLARVRQSAYKEAAGMLPDVPMKDMGTFQKSVQQMLKSSTASDAAKAEVSNMLKDPQLAQEMKSHVANFGEKASARGVSAADRRLYRQTLDKMQDRMYKAAKPSGRGDEFSARWNDFEKVHGDMQGQTIGRLMNAQKIREIEKYLDPESLRDGQSYLRHIGDQNAQADFVNDLRHFVTDKRSAQMLGIKEPNPTLKQRIASNPFGRGVVKAVASEGGYLAGGVPGAVAMHEVARSALGKWRNSAPESGIPQPQMNPLKLGQGNPSPFGVGNARPPAPPTGLLPSLLDAVPVGVQPPGGWPQTQE